MREFFQKGAIVGTKAQRKERTWCGRETCPVPIQRPRGPASDSVPPGVPGARKTSIHFTPYNGPGSQAHKGNLGSGFLHPATSSAFLIRDPWSALIPNPCPSSSWHLYPLEPAILSRGSAPLSSLQWPYFSSTMPPVYHLPQHATTCQL